MKTKRLDHVSSGDSVLLHQQVERDGKRHPFFAGCFGIFGHGCIAGWAGPAAISPQFRYYMTKMSKASVHIATAFAKMSNRLRACACISSIGPGATNMITGAATATINRIPVLLMPGDIFARRNVGPVLNSSSNPTPRMFPSTTPFGPFPSYWDRINRADQIIVSLPEVIARAHLSSETGAVHAGVASGCFRRRRSNIRPSCSRTALVHPSPGPGHDPAQSRRGSYSREQKTSDRRWRGVPLQRGP